MNKWPIKSLHGKIHIKHGFPFKSEYFAKDGEYIVLTPGNFYEEGGFKRQRGKEKYYTGDFPEEYLHEKRDLIVAMTEQAEGLLGSCAFVPESGIYLHNQRLGLINVKSNDIITEYIYHLFKTPFVREQIRLTSSGSKVKHTSPERIYDVMVPLPSLIDQKNIADLLNCIDEKIQINNQINAKLEEMAKTIYDFWFVQFDFPISKEQAQKMGKPSLEGKPYKSSGGKMVYNENLKREIPEGWETTILDDVLATQPKQKKILKKDIQEEGKIPVIDQSREYISGYIDDSMHMISPCDPHIVFGDHTRILKLVNFDYARGADGTQIIISNTKRLPSYLLYQLLLDIDLSNYGYARHYKFLKQKEIILPKECISQSYKSVVEINFNKIRATQKQNQMLIKLRDWLLPMLMNGQVTVGDQ